jgi:hypothetical protein
VRPRTWCGRRGGCFKKPPERAVRDVVNDASFDRTFGRLTAALMAQRQIALFRRLLARQCDNRADLFGRECRRCAGRGASARRCATCVALVELRQRCSRWRTIYGQTPSWRAVSSTPIPAAVSKVIRVRTAAFRGVVCARTRRTSACSCAAARTMGSADRRGIGAEANRRTNR